MFRASEIKAKYPTGTKVIDCYGQRDMIRSSYLTVSEFKAIGTLVLGGVYIYDPVKKKWAEVIEED